MSSSVAVPRVPVRVTLLATVLALLLAAGTMVGLSTPERAEAVEARTGSGFTVTSLNLTYTMNARQIKDDLRKVIRESDSSVIGLQERRGTKRAIRRGLPESWGLVMPTTRPGTDDNPIAYDTRVWKLENSWPRVLDKKTWRRNTGQRAIDQYGVVASLKNRQTGRVIRAVSFHMPSAIHNRSTGGPNYRERDRVKAFWRMSANLRALATNTPQKHQFVAMCDCNVTESKDTGNKLVRGKITRPLGLENNYSEDGYRAGWRIDYVMTERKAPYSIDRWRKIKNIHSDHAAVVTRFKRS